MWQAALLELNGVDQCDWLTENVLHLEVVQQFFYLPFEDSRHNVGPIFRLLTWEQVLDDVRMPRIARERDEEIWLAVFAHDSHGVLIPTMQISCTSSERRRQDDWDA